MISRTRATVSSVLEVDGLPGHGSSSKDRCQLLKREYHSNVFDRLRQDSPKAACSISYVPTQVFPRRKQKSMHTCCCTLPLQCQIRRTLKVDVHWKASTERMRGDKDLQFCTYTCTDLTHVPLCCHFTTYYSFPGKKSVPELNDQPTYIYIYIFDERKEHAQKSTGMCVRSNRNCLTSTKTCLKSDRNMWQGSTIT